MTTFEPSFADDKKEWEFTPAAKVGQSLKPGEKLGSTHEGIFEHWIMAPFGLKGQAKVEKIVNKGKYNITVKTPTCDKPKIPDLYELRFSGRINQAIVSDNPRLKPSRPW